MSICLFSSPDTFLAASVANSAFPASTSNFVAHVHFYFTPGRTSSAALVSSFITSPRNNTTLNVLPGNMTMSICTGAAAQPLKTAFLWCAIYPHSIRSSRTGIRSKITSSILHYQMYLFEHFFADQNGSWVFGTCLHLTRFYSSNMHGFSHCVFCASYQFCRCTSCNWILPSSNLP